MAQEFTYSAHPLPCPRASTSPPSNFPVLAQRYAAARLEALLTAPHAFGSTYAIESTFTPEEWGARIWRDDAVVLVVAATPTRPAPGSVSPLDGEWVGTAILRGPLSACDYALRHEGEAPAEDEAEEDTDTDTTNWQMTAVFASAAHRGRGIGKMLVQAGKDYALAQARSMGKSKVRLRVIIHPDNLVVLSLYSKAGFVDAGRTTGKEAYRTNGDLASWGLKLASLSDEMKVYWTTAREGVVMEWSGQVN